MPQLNIPHTATKKDPVQPNTVKKEKKPKVEVQRYLGDKVLVEQVKLSGTILNSFSIEKKLPC